MLESLRRYIVRTVGSLRKRVPGTRRRYRNRSTERTARVGGLVLSEGEGDGDEGDAGYSLMVTDGEGDSEGKRKKRGGVMTDARPICV